MSDDREMTVGELFFGPTAWGGAVDDPKLLVETPVGDRCLYCEETIVEGDSGCIFPYLDSEGPRLIAEHRECFLRHIFGSVGHQRGKCSCYGGTEEDPEGMTKREAARAAVRFFVDDRKMRGE